MKAGRLKEILSMFGDDLDVYIQTVPDDFAQPLEMKNITLLQMAVDEKRNHREDAKVLLTAFHPPRKKA